MSLRDVRLKATYDSDSDDILNDFYVPALSVSRRYRRLAGFFSSSALAIAARGIAQFVRNGGEMALVCGAKLSSADVTSIQRAEITPEMAIERSTIRELATLEDQLIRDHVAALGWMVAQGKLRVKVALVLNEEGWPEDAQSVDRGGLFHQKVGVLEDSESNTISFSGSDNETASGWARHIEEFKIFRGWEPSESAYLIADESKFSKFWEGRATRTRVLDVPDAVNQKLIELAPNDFESLDLTRWHNRWRTKKAAPELWTHQSEAVERWFKNGRHGIFEMATGTGKTFAALECLRRSFANGIDRLAVLSFPYSHLLQQWLDDFAEFNLKISTVTVDSSNPGWKDELADCLIDLRLGNVKQLAIFTTHDTLGSNALINLMNTHCTSGFLIVDEVHGIGSPVRRKGLLDLYDARLGLSATPERWFDPEGTRVIREFFGGTVYRFTLRQAIAEINPRTGESYLTPYVYNPRFVELSSDEIEKYVDLSQKISRLYHKAIDSPEYSESYELLLFKRQRILNNAFAKYAMLESILLELGEISQCLVYCSPQQIEGVQDLLNGKGIIQHKFTMAEGVTPRPEFNGHSERQFLLKEFADGTIKALVAMKCLDEGVDIPPARVGILLASTGNPREFIQRRGRLLRRHPGKARAIIYDILTVPPISALSTDEQLLNVERQILQKETTRFLEFATDARNSVECLDVLHEYEARIGLS
jgi:superfamily II DNA or RNA helicase